MSNYTHLTVTERRRFYVWIEMGYSMSAIAKRLNRHRSTLYRELERNQSQKIYLPVKAHEKAENRRKQERVCKLQENPALYDYVLGHLKEGWSPEQISGRMKQENFIYRVCHETIYRYIYRKQNKDLYHCLAYKKPRRSKRFARKKQLCRFHPLRLITLRPPEIEARTTLGHWEGDSIEFQGTKRKAITTLVERKSRLVALIKNEQRFSKEVAAQIREKLEKMPKKSRRTVTFDQGSEFADYRQLEGQLKCNVFYCHSHSPWEKGSNENMNGRLRRYLPRSTDIAKISQEQLDSLAKKMNNIPRKCLAFKTPKELFLQHHKTSCRAWI